MKKEEFEALVQFAAQCKYDPYKFVMNAFHWDQKGTFLEGFTGPDKWQTETLNEIGKQMVQAELTGAPVRIQIVSGHEIGKTAFLSWIIIWFMVTRPGCVATVTANTKQQLENKTWRELGKWHNVCLYKSFFEKTASKFRAYDNPEIHFTAATPWSESNTDAFQGTHNKGGVLIIFDEASKIPQAIWEVTEGAMDAGALWLAFGNPTESRGAFYEAAHGQTSKLWKTRHIDSRDSAISNKTRIAEWLEIFDEDSDFFKVRCRGIFPDQSDAQFISRGLVDAAVNRVYKLGSMDKHPVVIGVDPAAYGDDWNVICVRQGLVTLEFWSKLEIEPDIFAMKITELTRTYEAKAVFVDATGGYGWPVIHCLKDVSYPVIPINFASKANLEEEYGNKRSEMWGEMKKWLARGGHIEDHQRLRQDLVTPEYYHDNKSRLMLEPKKDMKAKGFDSPDYADALALTFAEVIPSDEDLKKMRGGYGTKIPEVPKNVDTRKFYDDFQKKFRSRYRRR